MHKKNHTICIEPVRPDETEALLDLYVDLFYDREPLTTCLGLGRERMEAIARGVYLGATDNPISMGWCWMARDCMAAHRAVGFVVCDDPFTDGQVDIPGNLTDEEHEKVMHVQALMEAIRAPLTDRSPLGAGQCLHIAAIGVAPGYEGAGIATSLLQTALSSARTRGFAHVFAECTSLASRACHERNGFECLHRVSADTFSHHGVSPFAGSHLDIFLLWKDLAQREG